MPTIRCVQVMVSTPRNVSFVCLARPSATGGCGTKFPTNAPLPFGCCFGRSRQYQALRFLHGYSIVHKNIKSPNVLLDRRGKAKLSDFSLADISAIINGDTGGGYHSNASPAVLKAICGRLSGHVVCFMPDYQMATRTTVAAGPSVSRRRSTATRPLESVGYFDLFNNSLMRQHSRLQHGLVRIFVKFCANQVVHIPPSGDNTC